MTTHFSSQCQILADLWMDYREDEEFKDFIDYNDLGLPLAYAIANKMVEPTLLGENILGETWDLFLSGLGTEDLGFETLDDVLDSTFPDNFPEE